MAQNQIQHRLNDPAAQSWLAGIVSNEEFGSLRALGRRVCEHFGFVDPWGRLQEVGCLKALRVVESRVPEMVLPVSAPPPTRAGPRVLEEPIAAPEGAPSTLAEIRDLDLVLVSSQEERWIWNTPMAREHPRGVTTFAGRQVKYLIGSGHGWLGAVGFAAAARRLAARDRWMAWDDEQRRAHLERVVGMCRFLIRPGVECPNLASHVLGRVLRRMPVDFEVRYGYRPWLVETFVEGEYRGTSLKAANFVRVGETAGRGREDRDKRRAESVKGIFVYAVDPDWRKHLGVAWVDHAPSREPGEGQSGDGWAETEFGEARLGHRRRTTRLVSSATLLAECPGRSIDGSVNSDPAAKSGYYRLIEQPAEAGVTPEAILAPHRDRTIERMRGQETVLLIQDGTDLNFANRPGTEGLGIIGRNQTSAKTLGLHLHATLAVSGGGLPLGVMRLGFEAPPVRKKEGGRRKIERWKEGLADSAEASREVSRKTRVVAVCDREADAFEVFDTQRRHGRVELLVRVHHDRCLDGGGKKLFDTLSSGPPAGYVDVEIEGLTARPGRRGKRARAARQKRLAQCELRYRAVTLPPTDACRESEPIPVTGVHIVETEPPEGEDPVQWFLLVTAAVESVEAAADVVGWYLQRWRVEDFFRTLKSGCKVEFLRFHTAERLERAIAINAVIAWRIMLMTLLGRHVPECAAELLFSDNELHFLRDYAAEKGLEPPGNMKKAVHLVATLGGYRGRKHDPPPGQQVMWHGKTNLSSATLGHGVGYSTGYEAGRRAASKDGAHVVPPG